MPVTPPVSYPGVYVQEIPSGVRTITGVPTSITAFIGRAPRGPVNEPITIFNYGDYERAFGGLHPDSTMSYAIRDFFANGGGQAIVVRLFQAKPKVESAALETPPSQQPASEKLSEASEAIAIAVEQLGELPGAEDLETTRTKINDAVRTALAALTAAKTAANQEAAKEIAKKNLSQAQEAFENDNTSDAAAALAEAEKALNELTAVPLASAAAADGIAKTEDEFLAAASPGSWGNALRVKFSKVEDQEVRDKYEIAAGELLFTLHVYEGDADQPSETIYNMSVKESKRRIDRVLAQESGLVRVGKFTSDFDPPEEEVSLTGGADSERLEVATYEGAEEDKTGLYALEKADLFNLLCVPPDTREGDLDASLHSRFAAYCAERRAIYIVDPPYRWAARKETAATTARDELGSLGIAGTDARNAALYFPRVVQADPLREGQPDVFPACGVIAGVLARTDAARGVWKAPAGLDASLNGIRGLQANLTDAENGHLNPFGVNVLRTFPNLGSVIWGARTMRGADQLGDEYKYLPVRRLALFIEETLFRSTQWAVFEPNDEPLWAQLRLNIGTFMHDLFRQGAFQGGKPSDAYFVRCDNTTTTQSDIDKGIVNIVVGFAPLKPAEFVIIYLQQMAGDLAA